MTAFPEDGGFANVPPHRANGPSLSVDPMLLVSRTEFDALKARMAKLEKVIADASRAGFAWAGFLVHGTQESVAEVRKLVEADALQADTARAEGGEVSGFADVLAVMDAFAATPAQVCCGDLHGGGWDENGNGEPPSCCGRPFDTDTLREARAAVEELVVATEEALTYLSVFDPLHGVTTQLRAALVRVGGAK